jgi:hypothetical protein
MSKSAFFPASFFRRDDVFFLFGRVGWVPPAMVPSMPSKSAGTSGISSDTPSCRSLLRKNCLSNPNPLRIAATSSFISPCFAAAARMA